MDTVKQWLISENEIAAAHMYGVGYFLFLLLMKEEHSLKMNDNDDVAGGRTTTTLKASSYMVGYQEAKGLCDALRKQQAQLVIHLPHDFNE